MRRLMLLITSAALLSGACGPKPDRPAAAALQPWTTVAPPTTAAPALVAGAATTTVRPTPTTTHPSPLASTTTLPAACPKVAGVPAEAADMTAAPVDFNGDGTADTLKVYRLGTAWHVRGEMGGGGFHDSVIAGGGPRPAALGGARIDTDATEEAWVNVGSGAYTDHVSFYVYRTCTLLAAGVGAEAAVFPVGASVRNAVGLTCAGNGTGLETFTSSTDENGVIDRASSTPFTLDVRDSGPVLVPGPTTPRSTRFSGFACGRLTRASAPGR